MTVRDQRGTRASDGDRDAALAALQDAFVRGRISHETLVARVDAALVARTQRELGAVLADLVVPKPQLPMAWLLSVVASVSRVARGIHAAWLSPTLPPLLLPDGPDDHLVGRSDDADYLIRHDSVSRSHALLRRGRDAWLVVDLGSTNGTYVNEWRVRAATPVRVGDVVRFGAAAFQIVDNQQHARSTV